MRTVRVTAEFGTAAAVAPSSVYSFPLQSSSSTATISSLAQKTIKIVLEHVIYSAKGKWETCLGQNIPPTSFEMANQNLSGRIS